MEFWNLTYGYFDYNYLLGEDTKHVPPSGNETNPVWWQFHFVPGINLVPREKYTIVVHSQPHGPFPGQSNTYWAYKDEDVYSGGEAWRLDWFSAPPGGNYDRNDDTDFALSLIHI